MSHKVDKFIVKHDRTLGWIMGGTMLLWYLTGIIGIEYIHPVVFTAIWVPMGALFALFAYRW